jgi:hypothetical protein
LGGWFSLLSTHFLARRISRSPHSQATFKLANNFKNLYLIGGLDMSSSLFFYSMLSFYFSSFFFLRYSSFYSRLLLEMDILQS